MPPFWILGLIVFLAGIGILEYSILIGPITMVGGVAIMLIYFTFRTKYPVRALIWQKRHGNLRMVWDMATRIPVDKQKNTYKYKFKKLKEETKAARFENLYPSGKGEVAMFFSPAPGEYYQAVFEEKTKKKKVKYIGPDGKEQEQEIDVAVIEPIPDDLMEWFFNKEERARQRHDKQSAWERYYPLVVAATMIVLLGIVIAVVFNGMKPIAESWEKAGKSFESAATKIAAAVNELEAEREGVQDVNTPEQGDIPPPPDLG